MALKALDHTGSGQLSDIVAAIDYVTALKKTHVKNVDVVNLSVTIPCCSPALEGAIAESVKQGIIYVAAAGNFQQNASKYEPATLGNGTSKAALQSRLER